MPLGAAGCQKVSFGKLLHVLVDMLQGMKEQQALGHTVDLLMAGFVRESGQCPQKGHFPGWMLHGECFFVLGGGADLLEIVGFNGVLQCGKHLAYFLLQTVGMLQGTG